MKVFCCIGVPFEPLRRFSALCSLLLDTSRLYFDQSSTLLLQNGSRISSEETSRVKRGKPHSHDCPASIPRHISHAGDYASVNRNQYRQCNRQERLAAHNLGWEHILELIIIMCKCAKCRNKATRGVGAPGLEARGSHQMQYHALAAWDTACFDAASSLTTYVWRQVRLQWPRSSHPLIRSHHLILYPKGDRQSAMFTGYDCTKLSAPTVNSWGRPPDLETNNM